MEQDICKSDKQKIKFMELANNLDRMVDSISKTAIDLKLFSSFKIVKNFITKHAHYIASYINELNNIPLEKLSTKLTATCSAIHDVEEYLEQNKSIIDDPNFHSNDLDSLKENLNYLKKTLDSIHKASDLSAHK